MLVWLATLTPLRFCDSWESCLIFHRFIVAEWCPVDFGSRSWLLFVHCKTPLCRICDRMSSPSLWASIYQWSSTWCCWLFAFVLPLQIKRMPSLVTYIFFRIVLNIMGFQWWLGERLLAIISWSTHFWQMQSPPNWRLSWPAISVHFSTLIILL